MLKKVITVFLNIILLTSLVSCSFIEEEKAINQPVKNEAIVSDATAISDTRTLLPAAKIGSDDSYVVSQYESTFENTSNYVSTVSISYIESADSLSLETEKSEYNLNSTKEIKLIIRNSDKNNWFVYGLLYKLEYKDGNEWKQVAFKDGYVVEAVAIATGENAELTIKLDNHNFTFIAGTYRASMNLYGTELETEFKLL